MITEGVKTSSRMMKEYGKLWNNLKRRSYIICLVPITILYFEICREKYCFFNSYSMFSHYMQVVAVIVYAVEFTNLVRQCVAAHCFADITALNPVLRIVRHARKSVVTTASTATARRNVASLANHVTRGVFGSALITGAKNYVVSCVIALDAMSHVQGSFDAVILALVSVGNHVQRSAESVIRTKSQKSFSVPKTNQTLDSLNWRTVVTCLK